MLDPTTLKAAIFVVLAGLPRTWSERDIEPLPERRDRIEDASGVIAVTAKTFEEAAALMTIPIFESGNFARYVLFACRDRPPGATGNCDVIRHGPRRGEVRARTYWQLWQVTCPRLWSLPVGSRDAVRTGAACALRHWKQAMRRCMSRPASVRHADPIAAAFSGYRSVRCDWPPALERAQRYRRVLSELRREYGRRR